MKNVLLRFDVYLDLVNVKCKWEVFSKFSKKLPSNLNSQLF